MTVLYIGLVIYWSIKKKKKMKKVTEICFAPSLSAYCWHSSAFDIFSLSGIDKKRATDWRVGLQLSQPISCLSCCTDTIQATSLHLSHATARLATVPYFIPTTWRAVSVYDTDVVLIAVKAWNELKIPCKPLSALWATWLADAGSNIITDLKKHHP